MAVTLGRDPVEPSGKRTVPGAKGTNANTSAASHLWQPARLILSPGAPVVPPAEYQEPPVGGGATRGMTARLRARFHATSRCTNAGDACRCLASTSVVHTCTRPHAAVALRAGV